MSSFSIVDCPLQDVVKNIILDVPIEKILLTPRCSGLFNTDHAMELAREPAASKTTCQT
jgi:hypothetical protein